MQETVQIRVHHGDASSTLIYLPGLHGDWTLVGGFRQALNGRVRFVEVTYPRTLEWSLEDYARGVEEALETTGITSGWLLAESFGSQIVWPLLVRRKLKLEAVILAGGFVRHPLQWGVRLAERVAGEIPLSLLTRMMFGYAKVARFRYRRSPETLANIHEFVERRTELDRQAAKHRLHLIAGNDPRFIARGSDTPIYALSGLIDPIVPWFLIRRWLRRHCPALREYRVIRQGDHNILGTAPAESAKAVLQWMKVL